MFDRTLASSENGVRSAQKMQVGRCIHAGTQLQKAEASPTSGPTRRLSHLCSQQCSRSTDPAAFGGLGTRLQAAACCAAPRRADGSGCSRASMKARACMDEGVLSFVTGMCCTYLNDPYKLEWGRIMTEGPRLSAPGRGAVRGRDGVRPRHHARRRLRHRAERGADALRPDHAPSLVDRMTVWWLYGGTKG